MLKIFSSIVLTKICSHYTIIVFICSLLSFWNSRVGAITILTFVSLPFRKLDSNLADHGRKISLIIIAERKLILYIYIHRIEKRSSLREFLILIL